MSDSDFRITDSIRALFMCASGVIQFHIVLHDKQVGKIFLYSLKEAAALGTAIVKTGSWDDVSDITSTTHETRPDAKIDPK